MQHSTKDKLHALINAIEDEGMLNLLLEDVVFYAGKKDIIDELSTGQSDILNKAIEEADNNETISFSAFKKEMDEWKKKL